MGELEEHTKPIWSDTLILHNHDKERTSMLIYLPNSHLVRFGRLNIEPTNTAPMCHRRRFRIQGPNKTPIAVYARRTALNCPCRIGQTTRNQTLAAERDLTLSGSQAWPTPQGHCDPGTIRFSIPHLDDRTERNNHCDKGTPQGQPQLITGVTARAFLHTKCTQKVFGRLFVCSYVQAYA